MGIYDRDYYRDTGRPPGGMPRPGVADSVRMWSVNTWIIVICVAVFVVDGFLQPTLVGAGVSLDAGIDRSATAACGDWKGVGSGEVARDLCIRNPLGQLQKVGTEYAFVMQPLQAIMHFSTARVLEVWRLIGFQFLHANFTHLLFNMMGLYFFGPLVERYLGRKRFLAFYLLCGMFGAIMYGILNLAGQFLTIPGVLPNDPHTPLIGASAGVFGVLMAGAYLAPNATVLVFFLLPMRLRTLAYALVIVALYTVVVSGNNAGGEAGHIGGAIAGFYFIRHPHHLHGFFDFLGRADPTSHHYRNSGFRRAPDRSEIDHVLDKVHREGIQSLSARERRILQEASRR